MLKRISNNGLNIGIFGIFLPLSNHIFFDYLFDDRDVGGFIYKRKPVVKDFQVFSRIFCSVDIYKKFKADLNKLAGKRRITIIHENPKTLIDEIIEINTGIRHLYISHSQKALISANYKHAIKKLDLT
jgi:hypothetical protein